MRKAEHPDILGELIRREPIFHRPEYGTSRTDFERMIVDDFWEVGASGRCYSREAVLAELERRRISPQPELWQTSDFRCRKLSQDVYLLTYHLIQDGVRKTRRTTIWQHTHEGWKIVYHQGTIIEDSPR